MYHLHDDSRDPRRDATCVALGSLACLLLAAAFMAPQAHAEGPIKIAVIAPAKLLVGKGMVRGAELAVDDINAAGGVDGRQLKLLQFDDQLSATKAVTDWQKAVTQDHVVAGVGVFTSEVALAVEPWVGRLKVPFIDTGSASTTINTRIHDDYAALKYMFLNNLNSVQLGEAVCDATRDTVMQKFHPKYAVILAEDAAWTKGVLPTYKKCLPKIGLKVLKTINFTDNTVDFSPIFFKINHLTPRPQIIITALSVVGLRPTVQWEQNRVPALLVGISSQATSSTFWSDSNGAAAGEVSINSGSVNGAAITAATPQFYKAFVARFHVMPAYSGYTTYDAVHMIARAIDETHSTQGAALVKEIESTPYTGVGGKYVFYGKNAPWTHGIKFGPDYVPGVAMQWQHGEQLAVWPKRVAQGTLFVPKFVQPAFADGTHK